MLMCVPEWHYISYFLGQRGNFSYINNEQVLFYLMCVIPVMLIQYVTIRQTLHTQNFITVSFALNRPPTYKCKNNYEVRSGGMEGAGVVKIFSPCLYTVPTMFVKESALVMVNA